jgi:hypothetical protein
MIEASNSQPLIEDWVYQALPRPRWRTRQSLEARIFRSAFRPPYLVLRRACQRDVWCVFFAYVPDGSLPAPHRDTLSRLKDEALPVLLVLASSDPSRFAAEWLSYADAAIWKDTPGFDFSGYSVALEELARHSPGSTVLVINDSVFGPIHPLRPQLARIGSGLTGWSGCTLQEPHLQSFAFAFSAWSPQTLSTMRRVFFPRSVLRDRADVIACQELQLARTAAQSMEVKALWYCTIGDGTQLLPLILVDRGFPFLKKSLLTARSSFEPKEAIRERLRICQLKT